MKLTPVNEIPKGCTISENSMFARVFPREARRKLALTPGQAFRVNSALFTMGQVNALAARARREGYKIVSRPTHADDQDEWDMFENSKPKDQADRRVVFITFTPAMLNKKKEANK
jgi:hypothetical protein